jgi:uncharacterized membrane-anchored protein YitT (DUF2179 family)
MKPFIRKSIFVLTGGAVQGLGMGVFLFPHNIPSGGAGGIAVLLHYLFAVQMGLALWLVNFSMLLIGVKVLGKRFAVWTFAGITMTSVSIHLFENILVIPNRNMFLDLTLGSMLLGTGIGLLMRKEVSNGGVGVVAFIIARGKNILPGRPLFLINCLIFFITGAVISWKIIILALISQWISTTIVDFVCRFTLKQVYTPEWRKKP